jgi:Predicted membrane protein
MTHEDVTVDPEELRLEPEGPSPRRTGLLYLLGGLLGLVAAAALTLERIASLKDANHVASCTINAAIDCAPAMGSWQGSLLGFPNPLLGLGSFPLVMMFGALLLSGVRPPRWMWIALGVGATLGMVLVVFLVHTSLVVLVVLCPYCFVVWLVTWPIFWYTHVNLVAEGLWPLGERARAWVLRNRFVVVLGGYLVLAALVVIGLRQHF